MARNPINPDIGEIQCPMCHKIAPVRKDRNGKLYYVSDAGMIKPNMPEGQNWLLENAVIWPHGVKPNDSVNEPQSTPLPDKVPHVPVNESVPLQDAPVIESPLQRISRVLVG